MVRMLRFVVTTRTSMTRPASPSTASGSWTGSKTSASSTPPTSYQLDDWLDLTDQRPPDHDSERWVSYSISDLYPDWQSRAHCAGVGVGYYFGDDGDQPTMSINQVRRASKLCEVCAVFMECLEWALTVREEYGVWASTSGRVRRRIFKMMDNGETTVAEVVEVFRRGEGDRYRLPTQDAPVESIHAAEDERRAVGEGHGRLRAHDQRKVAL